MACEDQKIEQWVAGFGLDLFLRPHVAAVVAALPPKVREEFLGDGSFTICDFEPGRATVVHIPMNLPGRSVVLKRNLRQRPEGFVRYVIAHELAHAHLRNGGRAPGEDPETAADALAAAWGFARP